MAIASLLAQVEAGASAIQLFDSWAGALAPDDYERYVLPASAKVFAGVGRPRRAPHPLRRGHRRAAAADGATPAPTWWASTGACRSTWPATRRARQGRAGQPRPGRVPRARGRSSPTAGRDVLRRNAGRPGHIFNLGHGVLPEPDPGVLAQVVELVHAEGRSRRLRPTMPSSGVVVMAYGTPAVARRRRGVLHPHPPRAARRRPSSWPTCSAATRPSAAPRRWPSAPRPSGPALAAALDEPGAGPLARWCSARSTRPRSSRTRSPTLAGRGRRRRSSAWCSRPHYSRRQRRRVPGAAARRGRRARASARRRSTAGTSSPPTSPSWPTPSRDGAGRAAPSARRCCSPPTACPSGCWSTTRTPTSCASQRRRGRRRPSGLHRWAGWSSAGRAPARTPEPWRGPDVLEVIDELAGDRPGRRGAACARGLREPTTSRWSTTSTSRPARVADEVGPGLRPHPRAQRRPRPCSARWPTGCWRPHPA